MRDVKGESEGVNVMGKIIKVEAGPKKFTVKPAGKKVNVKTTPQTAYFQGETESTFEAVVVMNAVVAVDLANGSATKVTAK